MRWVWALTDVAGEHYLTYAREVAHDGGGLPAVHLHLPDELGVLRQVSETAVAADVVRQFPAEVIGQEPLGESGEELVSQGGEAALGAATAEAPKPAAATPATTVSAREAETEVEDAPF